MSNTAETLELAKIGGVPCYAEEAHELQPVESKSRLEPLPNGVKKLGVPLGRSRKPNGGGKG